METPFTVVKGEAAPDKITKLSIKDLIHHLRHDQAHTLNSIATRLSEICDRRIHFRSVHFWYEGGNPRNYNQIHKALVSIIKEGEAIDGGAWCSRAEVRCSMLRLLEIYDVRKMHNATGIPVVTIYAWIRGLHRVPRARFNSFLISLMFNASRKPAS